MRRTRTPVSSRAFPVASAGSIPHVSASLLAPSLHGKPSQVAQRTQVPPTRRSTPIAFALGLTPCARSRAAKLGDVRLVLQGRIREGAAAPRLRRVLAGRAVDPVHLLGLAVVRLQIRVAERP